MVKAEIINIARGYASEVKKKFGTEKIFLFGSMVKGNYTDDSDIDIAIIFDDYSNKMNIRFELMKLRRQFDLRIEPHPFRKSEFLNKNPFAAEILSHGLEI
jgi:predicted nucleotidyltransferase